MAQPTNDSRTALLAGSTGLVGRELLQLLLADARYSVEAVVLAEQNQNVLF